AGATGPPGGVELVGRARTGGDGAGGRREPIRETRRRVVRPAVPRPARGRDHGASHRRRRLDDDVPGTGRQRWPGRPAWFRAASRGRGREGFAHIGAGAGVHHRGAHGPVVTRGRENDRMPDLITSFANPTVKRYRALAARKRRRREG